VRFGTFNVMHGASLGDGRVDPDRFHAVVADLDCDVLAIQEVDLDQPRSGRVDLTAVAADALGSPADRWRFVPALYGTPGGRIRPAAGPRRPGEPAYGIALLSRYPAYRWRVVRLGRAPVPSPVAAPGPDGRMRLILLDDEPRVAVVAVVAGPAGPMTVVTTHLSFVPGWNAWQLRRLVGGLSELVLPGPALLLGDLNLPGRLPAALTGWRRLAAAATYPATTPRVQFDHVLGRVAAGRVTGHAAARHPKSLIVTSVEARRTAVSDHRALLVDLAE
jgi:endonuclease/exonuclease/phosphatase family metal-dependent hydrolase